MSQNSVFVNKFGLIWNRSTNGYSVNTLVRENNQNSAFEKVKLEIKKSKVFFPEGYEELFAKRMGFVRKINIAKMQIEPGGPRTNVFRLIIELIKLRPYKYRYIILGSIRKIWFLREIHNLQKSLS